MNTGNDPEWLRDWKAKVASGAIVLRPNQFQPGESGNPKGRPPGTGKRAQLLKRLQDSSEAIQDTILYEALHQRDMQALALLYSRIQPPLRPQSLQPEFEFDAEKPVANQAMQIVAAVAQGLLTVADAKSLIEMLAAVVGITDLEVFNAERRRLTRGSRPAILGGVKTV